MLDLVCSLVLVGTLGVTAVGYAVRTRAHGAARFARVERAGSSVLLGEGPMHAGYWALQPVALTLAGLGVSANAISLASLALGAGAGAALAAGHFGVGALLAALSAVGDALDGIVARRTATASDAGEVLDAAVDRYAEFLFLAGLAVWFRENAVLLGLVLFAILASSMVSYATAKAEALSVEPPRGSMRRAERAVYLNIGSALVPLVYRLSPSFANAPVVLALALVAIVGNASAAIRLRRVAQLVASRRAPEFPGAEETR